MRSTNAFANARPLDGMSQADDAEGERLLPEEYEPDEGTDDDGGRAPRRAPGGPPPGPSRYRGGPPPFAPAFKPDMRSDPRGFHKWEKRVDIWRRQIGAYLPWNEAALRLYEALQGDAEDEAQYLDLNGVDSEDGITFLVAEMRRAFGEVQTDRKQKLLLDHEKLRRNHGEPVKAYILRYQRTENALREIGVNVRDSYDDEQRGYRLLETSLLGPEARRNLVTMTQGSFTFDAIMRNLQLLYPENRSTPSLVTAYGTQINRPPPANSPNYHKGGGRGGTAGGARGGSHSGKGGAATNRSSTLATEVVPEGDEDGEQPAADNEDAAEGQEDDSEDVQQNGGDEDLEELQAEVEGLYEAFSVTAKKLKSVVQGRQWTTRPKAGAKSSSQGRPRKPIDKINTTCHDCGQMGHWAGDAECPKSKGKDYAQRSSSSGAASSTRPANSTNAVTLATDLARHGEQPANFDRQGSFFVLMAIHVQVNESDVLHNGYETRGMMVIDTACQRNVCGSRWRAQHQEDLEELKLKMLSRSETESFRFGAGDAKPSLARWIFPAGLSEVPVILRASEVDSHIPFLGSRQMLTDLDAVIALGEGKLHLQAISATLDLHLLNNGHLAASVCSFPAGGFPRRADAWPETDDDVSAHPEYVRLSDEEQQRQQRVSTSVLSATPSPPSTGVPAAATLPVSTTDATLPVSSTTASTAIISTATESSQATGTAATALPATASPVMASPAHYHLPEFDPPEAGAVRAEQEMLSLLALATLPTTERFPESQPCHEETSDTRFLGRPSLPESRTKNCMPQACNEGTAQHCSTMHGGPTKRISAGK